MTVAFIGHRKVQDKEELVERIYDALTDLIENEGADTFLFGSRSNFNDLCFMVVTEMKKIYPHIRRVYVRADYEKVSKLYEDCLLANYEETYYPDKVRGSNELCYVIRNACMVEACDVLVTYHDENYEPLRKSTKNKMLAPVFAHKTMKSGTKMAVEYAQRQKKRVINVFEK